MILVGQLAIDRYVTTFAGDSWKILREVMIVPLGKKIDTLYMTINGFRALTIVDNKVSIQLWYQRLRHISLKGMKVMQSGGKLLNTKSLDLELCESRICGKQKWVSFQKVGKLPKEA